MKFKFPKTLSILLSMLLIFSLFPPTLFSLTSSAETTDEWQELTVENGNFEAPPSSDTDLPSWDFWSGGFKEGMAISEEVVYEGNQSLAVDNGGVVGLFSQEIPVTEGNHYQLSAQLYVEELEGNPGIWLRWLNDSGEIIHNNAEYFEDLTYEEWQEVVIEADAPPGVTGVKIFIYQSSTSVMKGYYDNVKLFEKPNSQFELPFQYGEPINMGPAALAAKTQGAAIGEGELYYATNGSPATFYAADSETGEVIFSESLPGSDVVWGMTIGSDGNVYFAGTYNGILYRYVVDEQRLEQVGKNPSDNWVWQLESTNDGKIYGVTYPNAKTFEYDIVADEFTDLGTFYEGQLYARGLGVTDENIYVGIGTTAHLIKMNRNSGERTEIDLPITGSSTSVSNIWEYGNNLFIAYGTSLLTIDVTTGEVLNEMNWEDEHTFDGLISSPSPYDENIIYFISKQSTQLWTYDMETHETAPVEPTIQLPATPAKAIEWVKNDEGEDVLAILHHQIEYSEYNPQTNTLEISYPEVDMQGLNIQSLEIGEDNNIYMGGYQGSFGVYDTSNEEYILNERDPHQIEGIGFLNGNVYLGTYGGAQIYKYDPETPFDYSGGGNGNNPEMVYDIGDDQSRPFTLTSGEDKLFVGTISDYGRLGGSLTIYDSVTDDWTSTRNIIENQSIIGLAYQDGMLYGGSTISGGLGIEPSEEKAKMFAYDTSTEDYHVFDLEVEGLEKPEMIGELSIGPDSNLWGVAWGFDETGTDNTVIFAMDPVTKEIVKSTEIYSGVHRGSQWRPFFMRWDDHGLLYTTAGRKLTVIDPETMASKQLVGDTVNLMDLDNEGNIYYASGADLYKLPVPLDEARVSIDDTSIMQGKTSDLNLEVTLANGNTIDVSGATIEWIPSDSEIATIEDGLITGKNAGSIEVHAAIFYNGEEIITNLLTITVEITTSSLTDQINALKDTGKIKHSLTKKLTNHLRQAEHHYKKGDTAQAIKHLENFRKHLNKSDTEESIKVLLIDNVNAIEETFTN
ncbi:FIMAH domain-containing protein [Oceanobacillus longus]|uniref:FIMAH domain-containing protein n=1 Tax=Oceanobacillus longus TaxID=930120 RepID=A0ABV8H2I9_9BACI